MKVLRSGILVLTLVVSAVSCNFWNGIVNSARGLLGEDLVARVGDHKLYRSDLEGYIPKGISYEDSLSIARQYISSWASDCIILDAAQRQLSPADRNVDKELADYKTSLLKFRYEQLYINERLDTTVSREQMEKYYNDNIEKFRLDLPILRAKFMNISESSPNLDEIRKKMASSKDEDVLEADSLAARFALKFVDYSDSWVDAFTLAREFGTDYSSLISSINKSFVESPDGFGNLRIAYILDLRRAGQIAPLEYCEPRIREILLNERKHRLVSTLERDLLMEASEKGQFIVYENEK